MAHPVSRVKSGGGCCLAASLERPSPARRVSLRGMLAPICTIGDLLHTAMHGADAVGVTPPRHRAAGRHLPPGVLANGVHAAPRIRNASGAGGGVSLAAVHACHASRLCQQASALHAEASYARRISRPPAAPGTCVRMAAVPRAPCLKEGVWRHAKGQGPRGLHACLMREAALPCIFLPLAPCEPSSIGAHRPLTVRRPWRAVMVLA